MTKTSFKPHEIETFKPAEKVGLIATINQEGLIHLTLITSIMASTPTQLTLGQFSVGLSKWFIQENNRLGFLIMTLDKKMWRGKARWTHKKTNGLEYEIYNEMPMFRYNSYFGINTVHYLDLVEATDGEDLPISKIVPAAILTKIAKGGVKTKIEDRILKPFAEDLFNDLASLTFISYMGEDGFPKIVPIIQCQASDSRRLVFSSMAYKDELSDIKAGTNVAVFCMNFNMQNVLIRGTFTGFQRTRLMEVGAIDIEWVYNSMLPVNEQIYPEVELKSVVNF